MSFGGVSSSNLHKCTLGQSWLCFAFSGKMSCLELWPLQRENQLCPSSGYAELVLGPSGSNYS